VIHVRLGADGLARTRFAVSPLNTAEALLYHIGRRPHTVPGPWRARVREALRTRRLDLLAAVTLKGLHCYSPDLLAPVPAGYENSLDAELHQVATTSAARVRYEMAYADDTHPSTTCTTDYRPPVLVLNALQRGEQPLVERLADQMQQFWNMVLAPHWPLLRARLEEDIAYRSRIVARDGFAHMINKVSTCTTWHDGALHFDTAMGCTCECVHIAEAAVIMPAAFGVKGLQSVDPLGAPDRRIPTITYPAVAVTEAAGAPPLDELIGVSRARLLAALTMPRSTSELAAQLHLSPSTVSYHLQLLHRAGLVRRTRQSRTVFYQRVERTVEG
jgi:DNA-binding transcriptional ArsR family regulator